MADFSESERSPLLGDQRDVRVTGAVARDEEEPTTNGATAVDDGPSNRTLALTLSCIWVRIYILDFSLVTFALY
jgi:hypothetical protein